MASTRHKFSVSNKIRRAIWNITYLILFRPFSLRIFKKWRIFILRIFGAKVSWSSMINSSVKIWAPWNLEVGDYSCLGQRVNCYNQGLVSLKNNVTVSQDCSLCASSHDYTSKYHTLFLSPIVINDKAWIAAEAFVGPGVSIGEGSVIGARSSVFKDVASWVVVGGNPAKLIKKRVIKD